MLPAVAAAIGLVAALLAPLPSLRAQSPEIRGVVRSAGDSSVLPATRVYLLRSAVWTETDSTGRFQISVPEFARPVRLLFVRLSFQPDTVPVADGQDSVEVFLQPAALTVAPVVVRAAPLARQRFETLAQTGTVSLDAKEIARTPGILESDLMRTIQLLPGTVAKNDYTIGYNVRGGESDQNLVAIDGIPIFNPSHLAGLFSTFDDEAIDRVDFITGGFPAGYGGRLSSVLDVSLRTGDPNHFRVRGQVSLLASRALVEGPIGTSGTTYMLGGRRTYADLVVKALTPEELPYYFTDLIGKITQPLAGGVLSATGYWGRDVLGVNLQEATSGRDSIHLSFDWGNGIGGLRYMRPLGRGVMEYHLSVTRFSTRLGLDPGFAEFRNSATLVSAGGDLSLSPNRPHDVRVGVGMERYVMNYSAGSPTLQSNYLDATYRPTVWSAYVDDQWHPGGRLLFRPGLRLEYVTGADFLAVAPRAAFKFFLTDDRAITGSAGRYYQSIQSIRDQEVPVTIYEFWIGADRFTPVGRSDHLVLGLEQWFGQELSLSVEAYRKTYHNLLTPNRAQDLRVAGDEFIPIDGNSWGADVLLRRYAGRVRGWIAYSYGTAVRHGPDGVDYPPAHDRRHTINVVLQAPGPLGSEMGARWGLGSPLPYSGYQGTWEHNRYNALFNRWESGFDDEPIAGPVNGQRYPAYSRLDLTFAWPFRALGGDWQFNLSAVNLYNRKNVFLYYFDYGDRPPTRTGISQLPFLATFGLEFAW